MAEDTDLQKKQTELQIVNSKYTSEAALAGQKAWLLSKFGEEIPAHHKKMSELDAKAGELKAEIDALLIAKKEAASA